MRKEDLFKKNHMLGVEFDRYLLEHTEILEQLPEDAEIYFLPEDDPELSQENLKIAEAQKTEGRKVILVKISRLSPLRSRLQDVRLESMPL
jgi:hypothetical protein